jgi:hypothetical protein
VAAKLLTALPSARQIFRGSARMNSSPCCSTTCVRSGRFGPIFWRESLESLSPVSAEAFREALRDQFEAVCRGVVEAVNQAPKGQVINASEEKVRDLFADFRRRAYQTVLQMKINAAEAAFSPYEPAHG